jgi:hypothetical protein
VLIVQKKVCAEMSADGDDVVEMSSTVAASNSSHTAPQQRTFVRQASAERRKSSQVGPNGASFIKFDVMLLSRTGVDFMKRFRPKLNLWPKKLKVT